jgi:hypothetical protein
MRNFIKLLVVAGTALAAVQASAATNLVQNGDFEAGYAGNTEFNTWYNPTGGPTGWVSETYEAFNLYFSAATATTVSPIWVGPPDARAELRRQPDRRQLRRARR